FGFSSLNAQTYDLVIYGGTSAGISAAIQAARMGKTPLIVEPSQHLGGLTSGGLGATDTGSKAVIGGISREFYQRLRKHYSDPKAWQFDTAETFKGLRKDEDAIWYFEPKVAEKVLNEMLAEHKGKFVLGERLNRAPGKGVKKTGTAITEII
ncbi:MAG: FAD-dependent oxidoreductase, partial [Planctomycetia bacterium]